MRFPTRFAVSEHTARAAPYRPPPTRVPSTPRGQKRFLAIEDGVRESTESSREVLLDLKRRA